MFERLDIFDPGYAELEAAQGCVGLALQEVCSARKRGEVLYRKCFARLTSPGEVPGSCEIVEFSGERGEQRALERYVLELVLGRLDVDRHSVLGAGLSTNSLLDAETSAGVLALVQERPHLASRLVLELAESQAFQSLSTVAAIVAEIRDIGCRVALGGFGAGYATPQLVQLIDFDIIKIDGAFIEDRRSSSAGLDSLSHIIGFASCFAPVVVVEGVETKAQADRAYAAGATHIQSKLVSYPVSSSGQTPAEAERWP